MININTYIVEKLKVNNTVESDITKMSEEQLVKKMISMVNDFKKRKNNPYINPEFRKSDTGHKYRLYLNKEDSMYVFGNDILDLYQAVVRHYGTEEDRDEIENI